MENSCLRCGRCCTSFGVCITPFDIARIASATGKAPESFVSFIPEPPERERMEPAILINGGRCLLVLRHGNGRECIFYGSNGCLAYGSRPMLCRTYPFRMEVCKLAEMRSRACPERWSPDKAGEAQYLRDCLQYEKEVREYAKIAEEWNSRGGGDLAAFLRFAIPFTGKQ